MIFSHREKPIYTQIYTSSHISCYVLSKPISRIDSSTLKESQVLLLKESEERKEIKKSHGVSGTE